MSEDREIYGDMSVDDEDQLQPGDTLDDGDLEDVLDRGYSPPDRAPKGYEDYPTEAERLQGESLDEKLAEEEPEPDPYAETDQEKGLDDGVSDESDFLDTETGDERAGRLMDLNEGIGPDNEGSLLATDAGIDAGAATAEEAAMHIVPDDQVG